tara:strand:- start:2655 stop:3575 length:921 start_codon:yes stop_codon:yes gene_type:complete
MNNTTLYLSSRNNYDMIPVFLKNTDLNGYKLYNVDDCSTEEEIQKGKEICNKHDITFLPNSGRGLQWSVQTMIENTDSKFLVWCTHDSFPLTDNFFSKFDKLVSTGKLDKFGLVGFNIFGPQCREREPKDFTNKCGILGRAPISKLSGRGGWFRVPDMSLPWDVWGKPFLIDSPVDMFLAINVELFKKYITPSDQYHLFCAFDDISTQFLYNNVPIVCLPDFRVWHNQHLKEQASIPVKSARAAKSGDEKHFGHFGPQFKFWKERWGWERDDRTTFENVKEKYEGTLIYDLYHHRYENGPLKRFDI